VSAAVAGPRPLTRKCHSLPLLGMETSLACYFSLRDNGVVPVGTERTNRENSMNTPPGSADNARPEENSRELGCEVHTRFHGGDPCARKMASLRKVFFDCISTDDLREMVEVLKRKARQGDTAAIKLLWQYRIPIPARPDRTDIKE
jgi:hypothetical protein